MEFNFQKSKPPDFILEQLMTPRARNLYEMRGMAAISDFHQNFNPQVMMPNPQMESNNFPGLGDFHPQNSPQIPQFMFDQGSPPSNDENFIVSHAGSNRKDECDKIKNTDPKKSFNPTDTFFCPSVEGTPNIPSLSNDFPVPCRSTQKSAPFQHKNVSEDNRNNRLHQPQRKTANATDVSEEINEKQTDENPVMGMQMKEITPSGSKMANAARKSESFTNFDAQLQEFRISYSKMSLEKDELEKKITVIQNNLKDYQEKASNYKNEYEKVKEKLNEEIKNRETVLSQVEHSNNITHSLNKHIQDINNTLKLYEELNSEYKDRNNKFQCLLDKRVKEFESISSSLKMTIENLKSQILKLEKELQEITSASLNAKEEYSQQIQEMKNKLCMEENKSITQEKRLHDLEQVNKELIQKLGLSEKDFSEKYSFLESKFEDTKNELESIQRDNAELKIYREKFNELETVVQKLQQEKEAVSSMLDSSHQDLSKSEAERSEQQKLLENLYLEREKMNENISLLKYECEDLTLKLKEKTQCFELLFNENQKLVETYKVSCEDLETYKVGNLRLEEEIKKACDGTKATESVIQEMKVQISVLQKELDNAKLEIVSKNENIFSLQEEFSSLQFENNKLHQSCNDMKETLNEKDQMMKELMTINSSLEMNLRKKDEETTQIQEKLTETVKETERTREEMLLSVNQYREQFMNQLKEVEDKRNEFQSKYESSCTEIEKLVEYKKLSDAKILNHQESVEKYERKIAEMFETIDKLKNGHEKKENEYNEKIPKLKKQLSKLEEEKITLEKTVSDLTNDLRAKEETEAKLSTLEKEIESIKKENKELQEKLKATKSSNKENLKASESDTLKFSDSHPVSNKRVYFDEDFSDASSIDLPKFFDDKLTSQKTPKTPRSMKSGKKFFKRSTSGFYDTDIFG